MSGNGRNGKAGRIPKFESDPECRKAILQAVSDGMLDKEACRAAGIHPGTLCAWKTRQRAAYDEFREELKRARMEGKRARLRRVGEAAEGREIHAFDEDGEPIAIRIAGDWKADTWILSRLYPEEFSEKRILEHRDRRGKANRRRDAVKDDELRAHLDRAASRMGSLREPGGTG